MPGPISDNDFAIAFYLGSLAIHWYAIFITFAVLAVYILSLLRAKYLAIPIAPIANFIFLAGPVVLICARLWYVLGDLTQYYSFISVIDIRTGGLGIEGGVLGGAIAGFFWFRYYGKHHQVSLLQYADVIAPNLLLGQAIGRWGNFFNQEILGDPIGSNSIWWLLPTAIRDHLHLIHDGPNIVRTPLFLIESFFNFLGFLFLFFIISLFHKRAHGTFLFSYLIWYGTLRLILEPMRDQQYIMKLGVLPISIFLSAVFVALGIVGLFLVNFLAYKELKIIWKDKRFQLVSYKIISNNFINSKNKWKTISQADYQKGNERLSQLFHKENIHE